MLFTRKRINNNIKVKQYHQELERVKQFTILEVSFDERITTWAVHAQKVIDKCEKVVNLMRWLVGSEWDAGRTALNSIYGLGLGLALIQSVCDYGCVEFGSDATTMLKKLDNI